MPEQSSLDNVSIVLVNTKAPANIGSVARCMMNTGLSRLILVRPPEDRQDDAMKLAAGAGKVLLEAKKFETLRDAVADHQLVIGTSRHLSRHRRNIHSPRDAAGWIIPLLGRNRIALVFGREVNGLEKEDLSLCHELIAIPSSEAFPSLNLSHAVMVIAYELFLAAHAGLPADERALARSDEIERFFGHLQTALRHITFLDDANAKHMMFSLRQLFGRARLEPRDVKILRGILSAVSGTPERKDG
ncbi:MAG: RNA methyltransferase [Nitrospirae bacterium]|nr:RNA methyltransferase [Nitrospirota bacterium]NTW65329.1 RNA methyltransferase [Nitrospirota bacterium]